MGSQAKFGVFSPAVYAAKIALGNDKLNKFRGQAISLHSQYIGDFCTWAGAYHLRTKLIKKVRVDACQLEGRTSEFITWMRSTVCRITLLGKLALCTYRSLSRMLLTLYVHLLSIKAKTNGDILGFLV
jgi:hypothetical protein